jgi:putative sterol carrier protein
MAHFPSAEWVQAVADKLNRDQRYAQTARNWEGDMRFIIEPGASTPEPIWIYIDLWHGQCRGAHIEQISSTTLKPAFTLKASYENFVRVLNGELDAMQAMLTRKLGVQGNMAILMRNVPTVLEFVRCCREVTDGVG